MQKKILGQDNSMTCQVSLYLERLRELHDATSLPLRKAPTFKEALKIHQACGCFLFFLQKFKAIVPEKELAEMERGLRSQFMSGFLDGDLLHVLEEQVPLSADIKAVGAFRQLNI